MPLTIGTGKNRVGSRRHFNWGGAYIRNYTVVDSMIVQNRSKAIVAPMKIGHLSLKIESYYSGFTAKQWRNWVLLYSPIILKDAIPSRIYSIWLIFVMPASCCAEQHQNSIWWPKHIIYSVPTVRM